MGRRRAAGGWDDPDRWGPPGGERERWDGPVGACWADCAAKGKKRKRGGWWAGLGW